MSLLHHLESEVLSFQDLKDLLGPKNCKSIKFLTYDELAGYTSFTKLFKKCDGVVVLLQGESQGASKVGHFILLLNYPDSIEHFDSYGLTVDQELKITQEQHLTKLFNSSKKQFIQNTKQLQRFKNDIQTCGRWVVARYLMRKLHLQDFFVVIQKAAHHLNDETVTLLTMLLPLKN